MANWAALLIYWQGIKHGYQTIVSEGYYQRILNRNLLFITIAAIVVNMFRWTGYLLIILIGWFLVQYLALAVTKGIDSLRRKDRLQINKEEKSVTIFGRTATPRELKLMGYGVGVGILVGIFLLLFQVAAIIIATILFIINAIFIVLFHEQFAFMLGKREEFEMLRETQNGLFSELPGSGNTTDSSADSQMLMVVGLIGIVTIIGQMILAIFGPLFDLITLEFPIIKDLAAIDFGGLFINPIIFMKTAWNITQMIIFFWIMFKIRRKIRNKIKKKVNFGDGYDEFDKKFFVETTI